ILTGSALSRNWVFETGQGDLAMGGTVAKKTGRRLGDAAPPAGVAGWCFDYNEERKFKRSPRWAAVALLNAVAAAAPWPAWARMAVERSVVRASWRRPLRKRIPHSGAVRIRRVTGTLSPSLPMPSPSVPMSCTRKSENGVKLTLRPLAVTVYAVDRWQPLQPSRLNSVSPRPLLLSMLRPGWFRLRMKNAKFATSSWTSVRPPAQLLFSAAASS